ncbi:MAG: 50S ribosomal protein L11 methyltransferase [Deltaproteobacteria bacterium]|nr:50S ribosomal protein L11 methyltransferase [Deltaproteobacteria bacterium]
MRQLQVGVDDHLVDAVASLLTELGAPAIEIVDDETRSGADPGAAPTGRAEVRACFTAAPGLEARAAAALSALFGAIEPPPRATLQWHDVVEKDWATAWQERWQPQRIGRRLVVVPSWRDFDAAPHDVVLRLDPGMAFGTGTHETTRLCAEAIEQLDPDGRSLLDVGCGTGILALFAARLGARPVVAVDDDPDAIAIAHANAAANGLADRLRLAVSHDVGVAGRFDLVVANILLDALCELADAIVRRMAPGATLILSGLLVGQLDAVRQPYTARGLSELERRVRGEWGLLALRNARG